MPISGEGRERLAQIDLSIYTVDAVLKSAYRFTGRCYIVLQRLGPETMSVRLRTKQETDDADAAIGDFFNDLVDQRLRSVIAAETTATRNLVLGHALSRTQFIRPDLETADPQADPGKVAVPDRRSSAQA